jgi:hypothetical protein
MTGGARILAAVLVCIPLAGCEGGLFGSTDGSGGSQARTGAQGDDSEKGGISILDFGGSEIDPQFIIGVNKYLWNASLDVLASLPIASADAYGGVIITEWSIDPDRTSDRTKVMATVNGLDLTARTLNVTVFRETRNANGDWIAAEVSAETSERIEESILGRARQLRIAETR